MDDARSTGPGATRERWRDLRERASLRRRAGVTRFRRRGVLILQAGIGAALAWWVARDLLGHTQPFFAPITALVCLGTTYGQRWRRIVELTLGVAIGVLVGDVLVQLLGPGIWVVGLVAVVAMSLAALVGAGTLLTVQAGINGIIVSTLVASPDSSLSRWVDALVGGGVAFVIALLTPASPVRRPREQVARVLHTMGDLLSDTAMGARSGDLDLVDAALERARGSERILTALRTDASEGSAVVSQSALLRRHRSPVRALAAIIEPLDRAIRNVRVLCRRASMAGHEGAAAPAGYVDLVDDLGHVVVLLSRDVATEQDLATRRGDLVALGRRAHSVAATGSDLSWEVVRAQVASTVVDLLTLTGLTVDEARHRLQPDTGA